MKRLFPNTLQKLAIRRSAFAKRGGLAGALLLAVLPIHAAQVIVILRPGGTGWQVVEAEKITFYQKDKVRVASGPQLEFSPDAYKKFGLLEILGAGTLRKHAGGYLVRRGEQGWQAIAPEGAPLKGSTSFAALWSSTPVAIFSDRNSKSATSLKSTEIYAIIRATDQSEAISGLIADPANFQGLGEASADAAFEERMSLLVAVAATATGPGAAKLKGVLLEEMREDEKRLTTGVAEVKDLERGLKYVAVSAKAYPSDPDQTKARESLVARKDWLDKRIAILNAFKAGELWDEFLNKYSDFARWDNSFDDIRKARSEVFEKSGRQHFALAERYAADKNFALAVREATIASHHLPSDPQITRLLDNVKLEDERQTGAKRVRVAEDKTSGSYRQVTVYLLSFDMALNDGKLAEASRDLEKARLAAPDSPRVLFSTAQLQRANNKRAEALKTLDEYARLGVDDGAGDQLRAKIAYELQKSVDEKKAAAREAETNGDYVLALRNATEGLALNDRDLDFLLTAGLSNVILRQKAEATVQLEKYLSLAQAPGADQKRLAEAYHAQSVLSTRIPPEPEGKPNWLSGYKSPAGLFYCPISLMPNPRVADVKAKKQTTAFQWNGDKLVTIHTTSQDPTDKESQFYFDYFKDRGVRRVGLADPTKGEDPKKDVPIPRFTEKGTMGSGTGVYLGLLNHPVVDPLILQRLLKKPTATIVAGNPYFHPFVWSGTLYTFVAEYDDDGRVKSARQIAPAEGDSRILDFKWEGLKLMEIVERSGGYKRTMIYAGNKLMSESIVSRSKPSKIEYVYKGEQLSEAKCSEDPSIDNRSRTVTFR